ncbi:hypothetical protein D3OALGA1CA_2322 [Olavius algarvensis associated proteobacterium Delta 3]|nr:hypothetical protein D3OALGB2SA_224 [Olavius algarvensis associated proteobacterium Delta 3]CAB5116908.1 hypothetical protein D3OALGA1CA_2322 [Olavius algarvensis associated proteobacterium Delta 3]
MNDAEKIVLSASRRSDIPAFYMPWFMDRMVAGSFNVTNPFNRRVSSVPAGPDCVHTVVFWSKNFGPFIDGGYGERLQDMGYHLYFNFTINSESPILEPQVPSLPERLEQLKRLTAAFGPESIQWRFDPICFYRHMGRRRHNLHDFPIIARTAGELGVHRCVTSFMDHYPKIRRRTSALSRFSFIEPEMEEKVALLLRMGQTLSNCGIHLSTCCEKEVMDRLSADTDITAGACIPSEHLVRCHGGKLSMRRDSGQRTSQGCRCRVSRDIGSYDLHPCFHRCLFCYANPAPAKAQIPDTVYS